MPQRGFPWLWVLLLGLLLLAPSPAGRLLLDVVGGITLTLFLLPVLLGGAGLLAWTLLQRRLRPCPACGFRSLATEQSEQCPACGTVCEPVVDGTTQAAPVSQPGKSDRFGQPMENFDARDVTIDVQATELDE